MYVGMRGMILEIRSERYVKMPLEPSDSKGRDHPSSNLEPLILIFLPGGLVEIERRIGLVRSREGKYLVKKD
jgi:hypothetical protein